MLKYKPWNLDISTAWTENVYRNDENDANLSEQEIIIEEYEAFIKSADALRLVPEMIRKATELATIEFESEEIEFMQNIQREPALWEVLCSNFGDVVKEQQNLFPNYDWQTDRRKYQRYMAAMENQVRTMAEKRKKYELLSRF